MRFFSVGYLSYGGRERNKVWHKGSLGDEDDAQMSNTRITQEKACDTTLNDEENITFATLETHP